MSILHSKEIVVGKNGYNFNYGIYQDIIRWLLLTKLQCHCSSSFIIYLHFQENKELLATYISYTLTYI